MTYLVDRCLSNRAEAVRRAGKRAVVTAEQAIASKAWESVKVSYTSPDGHALSLEVIA
jgi:hypothetical protein